MSEEELKAIDKENKAINFYKNFIKDKEKKLEWMIDQDEEYYKDEIEQSELLIQGFKTILSLIEKKQKEIENLRIKNGKEFVRGMETNEKLWRAKIEAKIKELEREKQVLEDNQMKDKMVYTPYQIVNAEILRLKYLKGE